MSQQQPRLQRMKHRGSIRTKLDVLYLVAAFNAVLADTALANQVALLGNLFPQRRERRVTGQQLTIALAAKHPAGVGPVHVVASQNGQYHPPKRLPRDPHLASSVENGGRAKVRQHEIP